MQICDAVEHTASPTEQGPSEVALAALVHLPEGEVRDTLADAHSAHATHDVPEPVRVIPLVHRPNINDVLRQRHEEAELARIGAESAGMEEQGE